VGAQPKYQQRTDDEQQPPPQLGELAEPAEHGRIGGARSH
jgi:hypothetical protein